MLHLKPILQEHASEQIRTLYSQIVTTVHVESVPLIFQYLANFPDFFSYIWDKSRKNMQSDVFGQMQHQAIYSAQIAIADIYRPSSSMQEFIKTISPHEYEYLRKTTSSVMQVNATLLLLTIGIRESIKGVFIGQKLIAETINQYAADVSDDVFIFSQKTNVSRPISESQKNTMSNSSTMLAPLFSSGISVSSLPDFFRHVDMEMYILLKTAGYLEKRVFLEQETMKNVYRLPYELGASYQEIIRLAGKLPYFHELLYLLVETFPTAYPRMLFTTALMEHLLKKDSSLLS